MRPRQGWCHELHSQSLCGGLPTVQAEPRVLVAEAYSLRSAIELNQASMWKPIHTGRLIPVSYLAPVTSWFPNDRPESHSPAAEAGLVLLLFESLWMGQLDFCPRSPHHSFSLVNSRWYYLPWLLGALSLPRPNPVLCLQRERARGHVNILRKGR